ncbi:MULTISPECIES: diguanylate cyclase [Bacillus]|uniref:diguanylate cyclase n=1 Tax=Bacillus TaxID=1386 RepID=UPI000BB9A35C|nr:MULTISPECIES: diguanylate cyclase [Bacillus]
MISDLFVNITILITFIYFWHILFKNNRLSIESPIKFKLIDGVIAGFLGIILMRYGISVNEITILDLRHIPIILVAFYGGIIPPLVGSIIIIIGRYLIDVNFSSHVALFMMLLIGVGSGLIGQFVKWKMWKVWLLLILYSQAIFSIALYIVSPNYLAVLDAAILHILSAIIGGLFAFSFARSIRLSTELYFKYKEHAKKDALTQLYNVRAFHKFYTQYIQRAKEENIPFVLTLLDLDHFKKINDTYGHMAGDEVLKHLSSILKEEVNDGIVSRNGGEEFSILQIGHDRKDVFIKMEEIRNKIESTPFRLQNGKQIHITLSFGIAQYNTRYKDDFRLYQLADDALYLAKNNGRNQIKVAK